MTDYPRGSEWRKWDLHIHSKYSKEASAKLEIKDIFTKAIDNNISVVSITDHSNVDGLDEVWETWEKEQYNGKPIKEQIDFLPGVELRTERGKHSVHALAVFPKYIKGKKVDKKYLEAELLHPLELTVSKIEESGGGSYEKGLFEKCVTFEKFSDKMKEIGGLILVHASRKSNGIEKEMAHSKEDATEHELLNTLGDEKEKIMRNWVDICELPNSEEKSLDDRNFYFNEFGKPCVVFSDSHESYPGEKFSWIKADPTFEGLKQVIFEPRDRVCLEPEPDSMQRVSTHRTKYLDEIYITQTSSYDEHRGVWFKDVTIPINHEMVAIIGNKGSGKSAIADIVGLLGESKNIKSASFLNSNRFKKAGLAKNFEAQIKWVSGDIDSKNLNDEVDETNVEKVKYLPQRWFEELCNDLDGKQFSKELEKVVFTHLDQSETLGYESFDELIRFKITSVSEDIRKLKEELHDINIEFADILGQLHPDYEKEVKAGLAQKQRELDSHIKTEPTNVEDPDKDNDKCKSSDLLARIKTLDSKIDETDILIKESTQKQTILGKKQEQLKKFEDDISRLEAQAKTISSMPDTIELFGTEVVSKLITIGVDRPKIDQLRKTLGESLDEEQNKCLSEEHIKALGLDKEAEKELLQNSLKVKLAADIKVRDELKKQLQKPQEEYQKYLEGLKEWQIKKSEIEGDQTDPAKDTINYYQQELKNIKDSYPVRLSALKDLQKEKTAEIYLKKREIVDIYSSVKKKVDQVILENQPSIDDYIIDIEAGFALAPNFKEKILDDYLNLRSKGSFMVKDVAIKLLSSLIDDIDFNEIKDIQKLQVDIIGNLEKDNRPEVSEKDNQRNIGDQLKDINNFFDYLYGLDYLTEKYQLRLDNKNIESLSPGEKGALLLVFYLMLDQEDTPLIIDQPEDNLDNQSVARILVEFIKGAKKRRQIILVTHNPNLAVVADAEQVVYVSLDKSNAKNVFSAVSGSIENDFINKKIVDVLEGTMPAFDKRRLRYLKES